MPKEASYGTRMAGSTFNISQVYHMELSLVWELDGFPYQFLSSPFP